MSEFTVEKFSIEGLDALQERFNKMLREIPGQSDKAVSDVANDLANRSSAIVPLDTGDLEGSLDVRHDGPGQYEVGYYGNPYAWVQHEELTYVHSPGRQAKYLEQPFAENVQKYIRYIADAVKKGL